jgi:hypothetical protein
MVLSARGTISRNCCLRIVRLIDAASLFADIARLLGFNRSPIESDRRQKMEDLALARRGAEGAGIKIGWLELPSLAPSQSVIDKKSMEYGVGSGSA